MMSTPVRAAIYRLPLQPNEPSVARQQHSNTFNYDDNNNDDELQWIPPFQLSIIYSKCFYIDYNDNSIKSIELYLRINSQ